MVSALPKIWLYTEKYALYALVAVPSIAVRVKRGTASPDDIARLVQFTKDNGGMEYASCVIHQYRDRALDLLSEVADDSLRRAFTAYLDYVVQRDK